MRYCILFPGPCTHWIWILFLWTWTCLESTCMSTHQITAQKRCTHQSLQVLLWYQATPLPFWCVFVPVLWTSTNAMIFLRANYSTAKIILSVEFTAFTLACLVTPLAGSYIFPPLVQCVSLPTLHLTKLSYQLSPTLHLAFLVEYNNNPHLIHPATPIERFTRGKIPHASPAIPQVHMMPTRPSLTTQVTV